MTRIAMWSGPRNISTALMRSFGNRSDTFVSDEPFYAHYLIETGINHPLREEVIKYGEISWDAVVKSITGDIPNYKKVWYQKHMSQHNLPKKDLTWISKMNNILLIRHPGEVILSYIKKYEVTSITQLGYLQLNTLFNMLNDDNGHAPLIIDARDLLKDPEGMLQELCKRLIIPYYDEMLTWPAGRMESDGIWGKYWYGNVERSTGFQRYAVNNPIVPSEYEELLGDCMKYYQQLYQHRIRIA